MTVLSRVAQFFVSRPAGRTAAAQSLGSMSQIEVQTVAWERVQEWTHTASEAVRHNGTLYNHLTSISSLARSGAWEATCRKGNAVEADVDERVQRFVQSLGTLDIARCVRRHETVGAHWLIPWPDAESLIRWDEASTSELRIFDSNKPPEISRNRSTSWLPLYDESLPARFRPACVRMWRPDDEWRNRAWSPVASVLQHIEALHLMNLAEMASDRNRLASAGIMFIPNDIAGIDPRDPSKSSTFASITKAATTAIADPTSVSSVVPVFLTGPGDSGEKIRHLVMERRENPAEFEKRRQSHLEEIARALSSPAGRVLGTEDQAKFANAAAMDFDTLRTYLPAVTWGVTQAVNAVYRSVRAQWGMPTYGCELKLSFDGLKAEVDRTRDALELRRAGVLTIEGVAEMAKIPEKWRLRPESAEYKRWLDEEGIMRGTQPSLSGPQSIVRSTHPPEPQRGLPAATAALPARVAPRLASLEELDAALGVVAAAARVETDREVLVVLGDRAIATDTKINLASVAINGNLLFKGLGLSRAEMPQLDGDRQQKFLAALKADGVEVGKPTETDPSTLWASQSELSARKAREISLAKNLDEILAEPIIISENNFVLDGHHRFVAAIMVEKPIMTVQAGLTIVPLLERADDFAGKTKSFTASASNGPDWPSILAKAAAIDRRLHDRIHAAASHALETALRRAGVKSFNKASAAQKRQLAEVPRQQITATLGPAVLAAFGLSDDELLVNAADDLLPIVGGYIDDAYAAVAGLGFSAGSPDWRQAGVAELGDGFLKVARAALHVATPPVVGERSTGKVPQAMVAVVVAKAGGVAPDGPDQVYVGGPGQGRALRSAMAAAVNPPIVEYVWHWGYYGASQAAYGPHFGMDGKRWPSLHDPGLLNPTSGPHAWTGSVTVHPLDHPGCNCGFVLEVAKEQK